MTGSMLSSSSRSAKEITSTPKVKKVPPRKRSMRKSWPENDGHAIRYRGARSRMVRWRCGQVESQRVHSPNVLWFRGCIDATSLHRCNLLHRCNFECCVSFCLIQTCKVEEIESGRDKTLNPNPQLMNNRIATCHSGIISPTIKWYNMALSREYHRVSEMNRIMRDYLDFLCD